MSAPSRIGQTRRPVPGRAGGTPAPIPLFRRDPEEAAYSCQHGLLEAVCAVGGVAFHVAAQFGRVARGPQMDAVAAAEGELGAVGGIDADDLMTRQVRSER